MMLEAIAMKVNGKQGCGMAGAGQSQEAVPSMVVEETCTKAAGSRT
jgi:hypothetical protein